MQRLRVNVDCTEAIIGRCKALQQRAEAWAAEVEAAAEAVAKAQSEAEAVALGQPLRPRLSAMELLALLETKWPIYGTAEAGYARWPDPDMQRQGAAIAAGGILRRLFDRDYIASALLDTRCLNSVA